MSEKKTTTKNKSNFYTNPCLQTHPICQQTIRGCRPTLEHRPQILFFIFGMLHLFIGIMVVCCDQEVREYKIRYDDKCRLSADSPKGQATITFDNPTITSQLYIYYELHDFYQSFFRYQKSYSDKQLMGVYDDDGDSCGPIKSKKHLYNEGHLTLNDESDENETVLMPCGNLATTFFTDYYTIESADANFKDTEIAWSHEIGSMYKSPNHDYSNASRWMLKDEIAANFPGETMNEHFVVWMRLSGHPTFRKIFAKSTGTTPANLKIKVNCDYSYNMFKGERYLVLEKLGGLGGKNQLLGTLSFILFALNVVFVIVFLVAKKVKSVRRRKKEIFSENAGNEIIQDLDTLEDLV